MQTFVNRKDAAPVETGVAGDQRGFVFVNVSKQ